MHVYLIFFSSLFLDCSSNRTKTSGVTIDQSKKIYWFNLHFLDFHFILITQIMADNDIIRLQSCRFHFPQVWATLNTSLTVIITQVFNYSLFNELQIHYLQISRNSVIVPLSKLGDNVAMCRRKGRVANCSSVSIFDFEELEILF